MVYTKIKSALSPEYQNLRMKTYIDHALKTSQYLCNRRPDEWKVVQNAGFPDQDVQELLVDFDKLKVQRSVEIHHASWMETTYGGECIEDGLLIGHDGEGLLSLQYYFSSLKPNQLKFA